MSSCFWNFSYSPLPSQADTATCKHSLNHHIIFFLCFLMLVLSYHFCFCHRSHSVSLAFLSFQISLAHSPSEGSSLHTLLSQGFSLVSSSGVWFTPASSQLLMLAFNPYLASGAPQGLMHQTSPWSSSTHALRSGHAPIPLSFPTLYKIQTSARLDSRFQGLQVRSQPHAPISYWEGKTHT